MLPLEASITRGVRFEIFLYYKITDEKCVTVEEYLEQYTGKLDQQVYYVSDPIQQAQYIKMLKDRKSVV